MGRNADIKRYEVHPEGQPMDLFAAAAADARRAADARSATDPRHGRLPVVLELLKSPWIVRASELVSRPGEAAAKRWSEAVDVEWDGTRGAPAAFTWRGKRYRVDALVQRWTIERAWWDPRARVSRRCFRVLARGGVYDLAFDRLARVWLLVGVLD